MKQELLDYPGKIGALFASLRDDELWHLINVDINYFCFEMISFETERWNWWFLTHLCLFNFVEWLTIWALKYCICSYLTLGNIFSNNVVTLTTNIIYIASSYNEWFNLTAILSIYWSCSFLRFRCNPTSLLEPIFFPLLSRHHLFKVLSILVLLLCFHKLLYRLCSF